MSNRIRVFSPRSTLFVLCWATMTLAVLIGRPSTAAAQDVLAATPPAPPSPPALIAPADGGTTTPALYPPLAMPTFTWERLATAALYHLQVSNSPGFATLLLDVDTYGTSYTPPTVWVDGLYFWRVKAGARSGFTTVWGSYSDVRSFTKDWSDGGANRPELLKPEPGAVRAAFQHGDFTWTPVPGAAGYIFEITSDELFNQVAYKMETMRWQHTPNVRLAAAPAYYWRVTPFTYGTFSSPRVTGLPSDTGTFGFVWNTPPQLLAPEPNVDLPFVPRFRWTAVEAAKEYQLQVSTDADFGTVVLDVATRSTDYTPVKALANDQDYYWRVKAVDARGNGTEWSEVRHFRARWNFVPRLLTPANNQIQLSYPFFSWEPVPGVERYQFQIDESNSFVAPLIADVKIFNVTTYAQPDWMNGLIAGTYFWRVRGVDAQDNVTPWSETWGFQTALTVAPNLVYPPQYFIPDSANLPVHRDESIAWPVFVWDTAHTWPSGTFTEPTQGPDFYQLLVDDDPGFGSPNFQIETRTLGGAPTVSAHPFTGLQTGLYFWRVRAYRSGQQLGTDARWIMRYDPAVSELPFSPGTVPVPIYPRDGMEAVATPPLLGWQPVQNANNYHLQVSLTADFAAVVDEARPQFVNYVPWQGRITEMPFGTYWWRVRAETAPGQPLGGWSQPRHFNLSVDLVTGNPNDLLPPPYPRTLRDVHVLTNAPQSPPPVKVYTPTLTLIATSTVDSLDPFDLGALHVMLDRTYNGNLNWVIAFEAAQVTDTVRYGIYFDTNHVTDGQPCSQAIPDPGAPADPLGNNVPTEAMYRPEYVIYIDWNGSSITNTSYSRWNGIRWLPNCLWAPAQSLPQIGGAAWYDSATRTFQLLVPYTALGGADDDFAGSVAVTIFSTSFTPGDGMRDSVPPQGAQIDNPAFVSDMLIPLYPFDTPLSNPIVHLDMPPLRWRMPIFDSVDGYQVQVARDSRFTDLVETWETYETQTSPFFALLPATFQALNAYADNESYYWRVRIRHERFAGSQFYDYGPWSPALRLKLDSRTIQNPALSTVPDVYMTPAFLWDRIEGAAGYTIQIDNDQNFSSPLINQATDATSYTPEEGQSTKALVPFTDYYWRVAMRRSDTVIGRWSTMQVFSKTSTIPTPLAPLTGTEVFIQPTFQWTAVLTPTAQPRLAAPRYRLQVDDELSFQSPALNELTEATAYTPPKGKALADGTWYWRVALVDANGNIGPYSPVQRIFKQYPLPRLLSPAQNGTLGGSPTFVWEAVPGAAYYRIDVADNEGFADAISGDTVNTSLTPTRLLSSGRYFWRVRMFDLDRKPGPVVFGGFTLGNALYLPLNRR